jgi:SAM-dependent methyltransferase
MRVKFVLAVGLIALTGLTGACAGRSNTPEEGSTHPASTPGAAKPAESAAPPPPPGSDEAAKPAEVERPSPTEVEPPSPPEPGAPGKLREPDVIFVPTPQEVVDAMLQMANVTSDDVVYDLGSGDGRIPITAAQKFGAKAVGIDINPQRIKEARANLEKTQVGDSVEFLNQDLFETDLSPASVVTLYLLPSLNQKLIPKLKQLKAGTRIVSHSFDMGPEWPPDKTQDVNGRMIYLWTIP